MHSYKCSYCYGPSTVEIDEEQDFKFIHYLNDEAFIVGAGHAECAKQYFRLLIEQINCPVCDSFLVVEVEGKKVFNLACHIDNMATAFCSPICYYNKDIHEDTTPIDPEPSILSSSPCA